MATIVDPAAAALYHPAREEIARSGDEAALKRFDGLYQEAHYLAENTARACWNTARHVDGDQEANTRAIARWVAVILASRFPEGGPDRVEAHE